MKKAETKIKKNRMALPKTLTSDLMGRQSVRATFKLSEDCINTISIVAGHLGIKQKSLFDHLIEDARSLEAIANELQFARDSVHNRIQKTFVISRKSKSSLDQVSKSHNAPRDALVEYSVQRLLPIITIERKRHDQRKKLLEEIALHLKEGKNLLKKADHLLDEEDPVYLKLETVMTSYENAYNGILSLIEKGKIIEDFQFE